MLLSVVLHLHVPAVARFVVIDSANSAASIVPPGYSLMLHILLMRHRSQVLGIRASSVVANVINYFAVRDRPIVKLEGIPVGENILSIGTQLTIATAQAGVPFPTPFRLLHVAPEPFF